MTAYLLRRLLWMVPTFLGILVINFAVLRLQGLTLSDALAMAAQGRDGEAGARQADQAVGTAVENVLARFRRTGNDLPALVNLRGFLTRDDLVERLRATARSPERAAQESRRNQREKALWLLGPWAVGPLADVLADPALADLHGPASLALSLCAHVPLNLEDLARLSLPQQAHVRARNERLMALRIAHVNTIEGGFATTDPEAEAKRAALVALVAQDAAEFRPGALERWLAILGRTGFTDFLARLATGRLFSETRKDYVFSVIADRWYTTFWLNLAAIVIAWCVSIPLGMRSARRAGSLEDRSTTTALFLAWSLPTFFVGTLLLHHLCIDGKGSVALFPNRGLSSPGAFWLPPAAYLLDLAWHAVLPLTVLCYASFTSLSRYMRANVLDQLSSDYVRTARAKGADEDRVVHGHVRRNSLVTMITLGSGLLAELFGGFVFVEYIFSINGLGSLLVDAAKQQDAPLVMGATVVSVALLLVGILIADILYAVVDPRIRSRYA